MTVSANAGDNVAVAGVQFQLDGVNLGIEDTSVPYSISWNSTTASNGTHTLRAIARDAAGNTTTSGGITITVDNPETSLGAHWTFNEGSGVTAGDSSGNGNVATLENGAGWAAGQVLGGMSLDGANDYAQVADAATLHGNNYTLAVWIRSTNMAGLHVVLSKPYGTGTDNSYILYLDNGRLTFHTTAFNGHIVHATALSVNVWYHVAVVKEGTATRMYVNGAQVGTANTAPATVSYDSHALLLGAENDGAGPAYFFAGRLDEGRVYTRALSAAEIGALAAEGGGPDTIPPTVSMTAPANGATVSGGSVTVSANASDNVGVEGVQFQLDGANLGSEDTSAPYSISWNSTTVSNGSHTLRAIARDEAGNTTPSTTITVTVNNGADTTPPTVSMTAPANGATISGGSVTVSANASDNVGVVGVQFQLDGVNLGSEDTSAPYSISWNSATASNGSHTLRAIARDAAGNATTSTAITVTVNNSGLVAHWQLNEGSGTGALDSSGNGNNGTLLNGPNWGTGQVGGGLTMDGIDDVMRVFDHPTIRVNDFTIAVWFRANGSAAPQGIVAKGYGPSYDNSYNIYVYNGLVQFDLPQFAGHMSYGPISPGVWYHAAVTKTGTITRMYVNGVEVASSSDAPVSVLYDSRPILVGADDDDANGIGELAFGGKIDDVRIYNRPLTASEIVQLRDLDNTAPAMSDISALTGTTAATVSWKTDEFSDSQVEFGLTSTYGSVSPLDTAQVATHGVSLPSLTPNTTYHYRVLSRDDNGNLAISADQQFTTASASAFLNHILSTGQSLSQGEQGSPALTLTQPYNNLMLSGSTLVPLVESSVETISSAMANNITFMNGGSSYRSAVTRHGVGGFCYWQLKKGTAPYSNGINQVLTARSAALSLGIPYRVSAVTTIHGEADQSPSQPCAQGSASLYENYLVEWQNNYETDVKAITGQSGTIPMFTDQMSSWTYAPYISTTTPGTSLGQLGGRGKQPGQDLSCRSEVPICLSRRSASE